MTADRLAEIRERLAAATPGPWSIPERRESLIQHQDGPGEWTNIVQVYTDNELGKNAAFIAAAPDDIAFLVSALEDCNRRRWHHSPDAPAEHLCDDCDQQERRLREALARVERLEAALTDYMESWGGNYDVKIRNAEMDRCWERAREALVDSGDAGPERAAGPLGVPTSGRHEPR